MKSFDQVIRIDQLRHANRHEGRMADQKSVVNFREESRDKLAYWLADRVDQLAFLTMAGMAYSVKNSGGSRVGSDLPYLEFAADVSAPSAKRYVVWDRANMDFVTNTSNASLVGGAISSGCRARRCPRSEKYTMLACMMHHMPSVAMMAGRARAQSKWVAAAGPASPPGRCPRPPAPGWRW